MPTPSSLKIMYLRDKKDQPVGCVVYRRIPVNADQTQHHLEYEVSVRNPLDRFNKKMGREIALGRLNTHPRETRIHSNSTGKEAVFAVLDQIANTPSLLPARAIKAAKAMLLFTKNEAR